MTVLYFEVIINTIVYKVFIIVGISLGNCCVGGGMEEEEEGVGEGDEGGRGGGGGGRQGFS